MPLSPAISILKGKETEMLGGKYFANPDDRCVNQFSITITKYLR
jgi:hypothetical protein